MIQIKIFGTTPPCARCKEMERRAQSAAARYPGKVEVAKFDALSEERDRYGIMLTPTVFINDKIIAVGKLPSEEDLEESIKKELEARS